MQAFTTRAPRYAASCKRARFVRAAAGQRRQEANVAPASLEAALLTLGTSVAVPLLCAHPALAKGGELGLLEGRSIALIHPIIMGSLLVTSLWAGWLGLQVRSG
jgi:hypothetical protein